MGEEIEELCAQRLRDLRRSRGLTLDQCESMSGGVIKAVVLGSYERGTRAISLARLTQLAPTTRPALVTHKTLRALRTHVTALA